MAGRCPLAWGCGDLLHGAQRAAQGGEVEALGGEAGVPGGDRRVQVDGWAVAVSGQRSGGDHVHLFHLRRGCHAVGQVGGVLVHAVGGGEEQVDQAHGNGGDAGKEGKRGKEEVSGAAAQGTLAQGYRRMVQYGGKVKQEASMSAGASSLAVKRTQYREALEQSVAAIQAALAHMPQVHRAILFGSYAAGRRDLWTDLDLLIIADSSLDFVARTAEMRRALSVSVDLDLLVYTPEEIERCRDRGFLRRALAEGIVIYEKNTA